MKSRIFLLFAVAFCHAASLSAQRADTLIVNIADVVVRENRIRVPLSRKPAAVSIIDLDSRIDLPADGIAGVLHFVPGVDIRTRGVNGVQNDLSIRGSSFDQVLLMVNGMKVSDPQTGHHNMNLPVSPDAISRVEIYRGPSARVFGQNAFAGAINIITRIPTGNRVTAGFRAGDFGMYSGDFSVSAGPIDFRNLFAASYNRSSGYRYNTDYRMANIFYQSEIFTRPGNISLQAGYSARDFGANGFYASPDYSEQYEKVGTATASLSFEPRTTRGYELSVRIYGRVNDDEYLFIRSDPSYYRNLHSTLVAGADINIVLESRSGTTGIGADINRQSIRSSRLGEHSRIAGTLFLDHRMELAGGRFSLSPGVQAVYFSDFSSMILPGIDIGFRISEKLLSYFNSGYTYRIPTYTDLYYQDPVNGSNPALRPEMAFSNEAGIRSTGRGIAGYSAGIFHRKGRDLIDRVRYSTDEPWLPVNIHTINFTGFEAALEIDFAALNGVSLPFERIDAGYTRIFTRREGELPPYSRLMYDNLRDQAHLSLTVRYLPGLIHTTGVRYYNRANMEDYTVIDTRLAYRFSRLNLFAEITNIASVEYRETNLVPMPGRWFSIGITLKTSI